MNNLRVIVPGLILLIAACSSTTSVREGSSLSASKAVTMVLTANRHLEIEPCGCSIAPLGGLEREWNALQRVKTKRAGDAILSFSAGTTFIPVSRSFDVKKKDYYIRKAAFLMEGMNTLGVNALSPSVDDFIIGMDKVRELEKKADFPFVSSNLYSKSDHKPLFKRYAEYKVGEMTILLLGVSHSPTGKYPVAADDVEVKPAADALQSVLAELPKQPRFVVLLSSLTPDEMTALRAKVPQIQLAFGATETLVNNDIQQLGPNFLYYQPLDRSRNMAEFRIEAHAQIDALQSDAVLAAQKLKRKTWTDDLADARQKLKGKKISKYDRKALNALVANYTTLLKNTESLPVSATPGAVNYWFHEYTLDKEYDGSDTKMSEVVKRFKEAVRDVAMSEGDEDGAHE